MPSRNSDGKFILSAGEIAAFTVCPLQWKLKWLDKMRGASDKDSIALGQELHADWSSKIEEAFSLLSSLRYVFASACAAVVAFLFVRLEQRSRMSAHFGDSRYDLLELVFVMAAVIGVTAIVGKAGRSKKRESGFKVNTNPINSDDGVKREVADMVSSKQGLAGRPDAIVMENGFAIPVERKPLAKKLRDRYVTQLLVYLRLIEEFEGKRPPYGYLIIGAACRRIKINNTSEKQAELQQYIDQMQAVLHGQEAKPSPQYKKCSKCDVRHACKAGQEMVSNIGRRA